MSKQNTVVQQRLSALRQVMEREGLQAYIIPSADPHLSEYVAPHWMAREWISGFTGSAGTVVVTAHKAGLWTDSRYFLQAAEQLEGTGIDLYKEMLPETPSIPGFLRAELGQDLSCVGFDDTLLSLKAQRELSHDLLGYDLVGTRDLFEEIWTDRLPLPDAPAEVYDLQYAGRTVGQKLGDIRQAMLEAGAEALLIPTLDEIAWTLNLRGSDVHCNPVVVSYLFITRHEVHYFIDPAKVTPAVARHLADNGVKVHSYPTIFSFLRDYSVPGVDSSLSDGDSKSLSPKTQSPGPEAQSFSSEASSLSPEARTLSPEARPRLLFDPAKTNHALYSAAVSSFELVEGSSPVALLKAVRNEVEIAGLRRAMERDGVALVKFLRWLEEAVTCGGETELSVDRRLHSLRAEQPLYVGESFDTIAGYREHGAIVHYEATPETDVPLRPEGFLLLDSGAQYLDGTTDITRTIALGPLTDDERLDYTLILKGHIDLAMAVFPEGTRGAQLDVLARMPIWQRGMNYLHGTGHGVGHYLNVHEGPQSIRMNENPVALRPGMLTSNEPGVYKAGSHGIRTENLVLCVPAAQGTNRYGVWADPVSVQSLADTQSSAGPQPPISQPFAADSQGMFGRYLAFETVTLCPICTKGVILDLLSSEEIEWLNCYHRMVYDRLSPHLDSEDERSWLRNACRPLSLER